MEKIGSNKLKLPSRTSLVAKIKQGKSPMQVTAKLMGQVTKKPSGESVFVTEDGQEHRIKNSSKRGIYHVIDAQGRVTGFIYREGNGYTMRRL